MPSQLSPRLAAVVDALPLQPCSRVLEIGCGPGAAARAVAARLTTGHILAIDRSAAAIAQAEAVSMKEIRSGRMSLRQVAAEERSMQERAPQMRYSSRPDDLAVQDHLISPLRSTKRPDPCPGPSLARATMASVPSVTV